MNQDRRRSVSFFGKILDKLGLSQTEAAPAAPDGTPGAVPPSASDAPAAAVVPPAEPAPAAVSLVDVKAHLEELAVANPQELNWKRSIVDLLKLLEIDSSYAARKELATELECPSELMGDSAQMNIWLHKTVLQKIADNGGNIPVELLD